MKEDVQPDLDDIDDWLKSITELYHHVWRWRRYLPLPTLSFVILQGDEVEDSRWIAHLDLPRLRQFP